MLKFWTLRGCKKRTNRELKILSSKKYNCSPKLKVMITSKIVHLISRRRSTQKKLRSLNKNLKKNRIAVRHISSKSNKDLRTAQLNLNNFMKLKRKNKRSDSEKREKKPRKKQMNTNKSSRSRCAMNLSKRMMNQICFAKTYRNWISSTINK